ncbi:hypothetical protein M0802_008291 [Mischocyttarus mexicanus]|nr:hypothetical protein M0802_008291 [Mischocyttarus mexicanus]
MVENVKLITSLLPEHLYRRIWLRLEKSMINHRFNESSNQQFIQSTILPINNSSNQQFIQPTIHPIFNQLHDIIQPTARGTSVLEPPQNFLSSE